MDRIAAQQKQLEGMGHTPSEMKRLLDPARSFSLQMEQEPEEYENRVRR